MFAISKKQGIIKKISDEILFAYTFYPASQLAKRHLFCGSKLCEHGIENACEVAWDAVSEKNKGIECKNMTKDLINRLIQIFKKGEKSEMSVGVEFEHFLINKNTLESYDYYAINGQKDIANKMSEGGWKVDYEENGYIFVLSKNGNAVSFEPGGQFEISIKPCKSIQDIDAAYNEVLQEINGYLNENQRLVSLGYHPKSKIDDLTLLPKKRYDMMYKYLHLKGSMARNMMKGTASTQVSIDFKNEQDFIKKFRVANFLSPFISRLFDASPVFEGKLYDEKNLRIRIWENTDISRCKLPKGVLSTEFNYASYANYLANTKPILMTSSEGTKYTEDKTLTFLSKSYYLSDMELEHAISMVFPDVRLKNYIEIRMADALPYPYSLAVPALIKGIFYNDENLDKYYNLSLEYNDDDVLKINEALKKSYNYTFKCLHENMTCDAFVDQLLSDSIQGLDLNEVGYLKCFMDWYKQHNSIADYLKNLYGDDAFLNFLMEENDVYYK